MAKRRGNKKNGKGKFNVMSIAKKALSLAKYAMPELKFLDSILTESMTLADMDYNNPSTTGVFKDHLGNDKLIGWSYHTVTGNQAALILLNDPAQGDQANERTGDEIRNKTLEARVTYGLSGATGTAIIKTVLIADYQPNSDIAQPSDVFSTASGGAIVPNSLINLENSKRFKILKQKITNLDQDSQGMKYVDLYCRLPNKASEFAPTWNAGESPQSGPAYYLGILQELGGSSQVGVTISTRVRYTD